MYKLIRASKQDVVISSEFLSELTPERIQKLLSSIGTKDLRVIFTVRPIAKILPSSYQQEVKNGSKLTYDRWLKRVLEPVAENRNKTRFWNRHSQHNEIAKWADLVGKDRVTVIISDESRPQFLIDSFFNLIGADFSKLRESGKATANRSMDLAEIELLRRINERFDRTLGWDEYVANIRSTIVRTWTHSPAHSTSPGKLSTPESFAERMNEKILEVTEGIKNLGVDIVGDVDSLSEVKFGSNATPSQIDIEDLIEPILARTRQSVLDSFTTKTLFKLAIARALRNIKRDAKMLIGKKKKVI
jgi:hypothetical protein